MAGAEGGYSEASCCQPDTEKSQQVLSSNIHRNCRYELFEQALLKTADRFVASIKFTMFKRHFREIYERDPDGLKSMYDHFISMIRRKTCEKLKRFATEENFPKLLNNLDELILERQDLNTTEKAWRPSGDPRKDLRPHRIAVKLQAKTGVEEMLKSMQEENKLLTQDVIEKHEQLIDLEKTLNQKAMPLEQAAVACQQLPLTEILGWLSTVEETSQTSVD